MEADRTDRADLISGPIDLVPPLKAHAVEVALHCLLLISSSTGGLSTSPVRSQTSNQRCNITFNGGTRDAELH